MVDALRALGSDPAPYPPVLPRDELVAFRLGELIAVAQAHLTRLGDTAQQSAAHGYHAVYEDLFDEPCPCDDHLGDEART